MAIEPDFATFARLHRSREPQAVYARLIGDLETPVSVFLKLSAQRTNCFLLESVQGGETRGRYSIIGIDPDLIWRCRNGAAEINRHAETDPDAFAPIAGPALSSLRELIAGIGVNLPSDLPPMAVGLFGCLGYDIVRLVERLPDSPPDTLRLPDAILVRPTVVVVFDNVRDAITVVTPVWPNEAVAPDQAYATACERLDNAVQQIRAPLPQRSLPQAIGKTKPTVESNVSRADYFSIVERAKEYIRAGDIFQVVPSQRFRRAFSLAPLDLYRALRRLNPSPFLYCLKFPDFALVGSSPEILVRLRDGAVTIRPIAGTRPRGRTPAEDAALEKELLRDPKERAEHLMLLDLGRNDVGRVAKTDTVRVTGSFFIERYSHVMHLVSNVEGELRDGLGAIDALAAGLPAGTLSGAPKIRAMQIIDEFETEKRGVAYGGAVGYFAADGSMDTCIVLRTALLKDGMMYVQAGGGVVADSDPEAEYQETVNKAKALFAAAEEAERQAGLNGAQSLSS